VTLQFGASLTDDAGSVNYDRNTFIIQATAIISMTTATTEEQEKKREIRNIFLLENERMKKSFCKKGRSQRQFVKSFFQSLSLLLLQKANNIYLFTTMM
jgi:hypothetical protein